MNRVLNNARKHLGITLFALAAISAAVPGPVVADEAPPSTVVGEALPDAPPVFIAALARFAETDLEDWHYLRTRESEEGTVVDRHDPTLPGEQHWQLVSIDGRAPTEQERRDYEKDRADHTDAEERADRDNWLRVLAPDSIRLVEEDGDRQRFAYDLQSPDGKRERVYEALEGEVLVEAGSSPWVREVRLWNRETVRPYLGVRIDEARLNFAFVIQDDWVLPERIEARWSGEILRLKSIGDALQFRLSDFRHVTTPAEPGMVAMP